jgi:hypothetical protein
MMSIRIVMTLAAALAVGAASTARADSVDGKPMQRTDRLPCASLRGSPAILFEGATGPWPLDTCMTDGYGRTGPSGAGGVF